MVVCKSCGGNYLEDLGMCEVCGSEEFVEEFENKDKDVSVIKKEMAKLSEDDTYIRQEMGIDNNYEPEQDADIYKELSAMFSEVDFSPIDDEPEDIDDETVRKTIKNLNINRHGSSKSTNSNNKNGKEEDKKKKKKSLFKKKKQKNDKKDEQSDKDSNTNEDSKKQKKSKGLFNKRKKPKKDNSELNINSIGKEIKDDNNESNISSTDKEIKDDSNVSKDNLDKILTDNLDKTLTDNLDNSLIGDLDKILSDINSEVENLDNIEKSKENEKTNNNSDENIVASSTKNIKKKLGILELVRQLFTKKENENNTQNNINTNIGLEDELYSNKFEKLVHKVFDNVEDKKYDEKLRLERIKQKEKLQLKQEKENKKQLKREEAAEKKQNKKAVEKARAAALKNKRKLAKERKKLADMEKEPRMRINKLGATVVFSFFSLVVFAIFSAADSISYNNSIKAAQKYYELGEYDNAYSEISGLELKNNHKKLYDRLRLIQTLNKQLSYCDSYIIIDKYPEGLDALLKAVNTYEIDYNEALKCSIDKKYNKVYSEVVSKLEDIYGISEEDAKNIAAISSYQEYSDKIKEICSNISINNEAE